MSKTNATALALRLAKTYNVDLSTLSGSGSDGRVTARDVLEHRNPTNLSPADSGSDSTQKAEAKTAPQPAPRTERRAPILVLKNDLEGFAQESDLEGFTQGAEADIEVAPQPAPRRRALISAIEEEDEDEEDSRRRSGSEAPRWMFWRRRGD